MNQKNYIFDASQVLADVRNMIRPHIGVACDVADLTHVIEACGEVVVYGEVRGFDKTPTHVLIEMGVPSQVAHQVIELVCHQVGVILKLVSPTGLNPAARWNFICNDFGDLTIALGNQPIQRDNRVEEFRQYMLESIENGDWFSENFRRSVGL